MQTDHETMGADGPRRNPTHTGPRPAAPAPSWWRSAAIVLVFALIGPAFGAIGAVLLLTMLAIQAGGAAAGSGSLGALALGGFAGTLIFALPVAYTFGLPAALLVGLAVARADRRRPGISWRTALGAGAAAGVVMAGVATLVVPAQGLAVWSATLLSASLVAALAGWAIAGRLFTGRPASTPEASLFEGARFDRAVPLPNLPQMTPLCASPAEEGAVILHLLDRPGGALVELCWRPGIGLACRRVALRGDLPPPIARGTSVDAAAAGTILLLSAGRATCLVDRLSGAVRPLPAIEGPSTLTPDGRWIIAAGEAGLLRVGLRRDGASWSTSGAEPIAPPQHDRPKSLLRLPAGGPGRLDLVAPGLAGVALVRISGIDAARPAVDLRRVEFGSLPHDDIRLAGPTPCLSATGRPASVFATDDGAVGLVAVAYGTGTVTDCPLGPRRYGRARRLRPDLVGTACLVRLDSGEILHWRPGDAPHPLPDGTAMPILWTGGHALLHVPETGEVREAPFPLGSAARLDP